MTGERKVLKLQLKLLRLEAARRHAMERGLLLDAAEAEDLLGKTAEELVALRADDSEVWEQ